MGYPRRRKKRAGSGNPVNVRESFESVSDYFDASKRGARPNESSHAPDGDFRQTESFEAALAIARYGWPQGARDVQRIRERIEDRLLTKIKKQETTHDVAGCMVDVGRFCDGVPECMVDFTEEDGHGVRTIRIAFNAGYPCIMKTNEINTWGAAIVALVDAFEHAGTRVELDAVIHLNGCGASEMHHRINVKSAQDSLDIDRLSFIAAHPSFLRRIVFGVMEGMSDHARREMNVGGGYGYCRTSPKTEDVAIMIQTPHEEGIGTTTESAVNWIVRNLTANGVEIESE